MIAHNPLHGSGRVDFSHPALALGKNAHAAQGIGMTDGRQRQPASAEAPHTIPQHAAVLTLPGQRALPEPADSEPKNRQRWLIQVHSVIPQVSTQHRLVPFALFQEWVHAYDAQVRLSPRPASLATFCVSFAARPMWVANPLSRDFFIHYNLAGLTGAPGERTREYQP
jgi:hypothetical protein